MISVQEVVVDPDMIAPQPFTVLRSTGQWVAGGFQPNQTTLIPMFGPVQQASDKEITMLPEADRIGAIRSFWSTQPIYTTRGYAPVPSVHGESPAGSGTVYTLSATPPTDILVYAAGLLVNNYTLSGNVLTFLSPPTAPLYVTWLITANVAPNASDQIQYGNELYRILRVYRDPGSGYWKCYGTRLAAA